MSFSTVQLREAIRDDIFIDTLSRNGTKISSCGAYAISRWGIEQLGSSFGCVFL